MEGFDDGVSKGFGSGFSKCRTQCLEPAGPADKVSLKFAESEFDCKIASFEVLEWWVARLLGWHETIWAAFISVPGGPAKSDFWTASQFGRVDFVECGLCFVVVLAFL